jgi:hypothetical protein
MISISMSTIIHSYLLDVFLGIDVGDQFYSRAEMVVLGIHSHWLNGIDYMGMKYKEMVTTRNTFHTNYHNSSHQLTLTRHMSLLPQDYHVFFFGTPCKQCFRHLCRRGMRT